MLELYLIVGALLSQGYLGSISFIFYWDLVSEPGFLDFQILTCLIIEIFVFSLGFLSDFSPSSLRFHFDLSS